MTKRRMAVMNLSYEGFGVVRKIGNAGFTTGTGEVVDKTGLQRILADLDVQDEL